MSLNKVLVIGRLGADPEVKVLESGQTLTRFSLAVNETWKDKEGQKQEKTEWVRVVTWGRTAELAGEYLKKGRETLVEGKMQTRSWETDDGEKRYATEVVGSYVQFLGGKPESSSGGPGGIDDNEDVPF